jgi:hypothetical protein
MAGGTFGGATRLPATAGVPAGRPLGGALLGGRPPGSCPAGVLPAGAGTPGPGSRAVGARHAPAALVIPAWNRPRLVSLVVAGRNRAGLLDRVVDVRDRARLVHGITTARDRPRLVNRVVTTRNRTRLLNRVVDVRDRVVAGGNRARPVCAVGAARRHRVRRAETIPRGSSGRHRPDTGSSGPCARRHRPDTGRRGPAHRYLGRVAGLRDDQAARRRLPGKDLAGRIRRDQPTATARLGADRGTPTLRRTTTTDPRRHLTGHPRAGRHLPPRHLTRRHLTAGRHLTGRHLTGRHPTRWNLTRWHLTGRHLTGRRLAGPWRRTGPLPTPPRHLTGRSCPRLDRGRPWRRTGSLPRRRLPASGALGVTRVSRLVRRLTGEREVFAGLLIRPGSAAAGLAGPCFSGEDAGPDRPALLLGRAQVVEPAGLLARDLLGNGRLLGTAAATPEAPTALTALACFVVGPFGTPPCHRCSSPALSPLSSLLSMPPPAGSGPSATEVVSATGPAGSESAEDCDSFPARAPPAARSAVLAEAVTGP